MKKIYLSLCTVIIAGAASAQVVKQVAGKNTNVGEVPKKTTVAPASEKITIWTNDFSVPADWTVTNDASPAHTNGAWAISTNPAAIPVAALAPAAFATAANGYALVNSDAAGATASQSTKITNTTDINLTAYPNVSLSFSQSHRRFQEQTFVVVSADGGVTWTEFEVNAGMTTNTNTTNPALVQVNISSVAGGQPDVRIGFKYVGAYDWFWAVDDIAIKETDAYDLALTGLFWGTEGYWGARLPYYMVPSTQVSDVIFGGIVQNQGAMTQNDVVFGVTIPTVFTGTSAPGTLTPGQVDTLDATTAFTLPATIATYTATAAVTSSALDAIPANNTIPPVSFAVTPSTYARDNGTIESGSYNSGLAFEVGNIFDIFEDEIVTGVRVYIHPNTVVGSAIYAQLYSINSTGDFVSEELTDAHDIVASDINTWITIPLDEPVLNANGTGSSYLITVGSYGDNGASDDVVVGTAGVSEAQTSFYLDEAGTWFYTTSTPMVRFITDGSVGLNENNADFAVSVFPNPAVSDAKVSFKLANSSDVTITVVDVTGKVVYTNALGNTAAGTHTVDISTDAFAGGVYTVNFNTNNSIVSKKLVVKK